MKLDDHLIKIVNQSLEKIIKQIAITFIFIKENHPKKILETQNESELKL